MKKQRGNVVSTEMKRGLRQTPRRKPSRHGFETISDIIHRLEDHIIPNRFDLPLSLQLDGAQLLREEMNEALQ
jgi:hypothetical protein